MASIYDPELVPPREMPFPAGTSPFRQKGMAYLSDVRYLDATVSGGYQAVVAAVPDAGTRAFFGRGFRASEWYDAYPGMALELTAARMRGVTFERHRRDTGAWHAEHAARGIYGALLKIVSNESIALWGPRISSLYFEFGKTETRVVSPHEIAAIRRGTPRELAQWLIFASVGFCERTLSLAGARSPQVAILDVTPDGHDHRRDLVKVELRLSFR